VLAAAAPACLLDVVLAGGWRLGVVEDRRMTDGQICGGAVEPWGSGGIASREMRRAATQRGITRGRGGVAVWGGAGGLG
jgi:hypothetical protein